MKTSSRHPNHCFDFNAMSRQQLQQTLTQYQLVLTIDEALAIQNDILKRPPTLAECVLWSIEGSEHCSYKSSKKQLSQLTTDGSNVIIGAKEDAGIIELCCDNHGNSYGLVISHESHNHPSQIVPYEGAATGVGGNVRDVSCMGAQVIAIADSLRFGSLDQAKSEWIHHGVISGIAGYGNPLGVPNIGGDVYYDSAYNDNCLVTVVTLGIVAADDIIHSYAPAHADGYDLILVGKATDNSGFGGASFSSLDLEVDKEDQNKGAVQEPNAFLGRHLLKANHELFKKLKKKQLLDKVGFKDLGAGGVACASVELAEAGGYGAEIYLEKVPVAMAQLAPTVILCSETQERYMWAVHPSISPLILEHYNQTFALPEVSAQAQAAIIGKIRQDGRYLVHYGKEILVDAPAKAVVKGIIYDRPVQATPQSLTEPKLSEPKDYNEVLLALLGHENIACREVIYENYDKQVQGRTIIEAGISDAGVIAPFNNSDYPTEIRNIGIALSLDHNPRYCKIDPYWGTVNAVAESLRNVAAVGASPQAITDCLCFGNPENPEQMWAFNTAVKALADSCHSYKLATAPETCLPVVAGNVSLYNESQNGAIPPSPMISCVGKLNDANRAIDKNLKEIDNLLLLIGERKDECGGSVYYQLYDQLGAQLPKPDIGELNRQIHALTEAIEQQHILSCHDISDGGLAVALAEMSFANNIGITVSLASTLRNDTLLFSESSGFIIEIHPAKLNIVEKCFNQQNISLTIIGQTNDSQRLSFQHGLIDITIDEARQQWQQGLRRHLI